VRAEGSAQGAAPLLAAAERCPSPSPSWRRGRHPRPSWRKQRHPRTAARGRRAAHRALRHHPPPLSAARAQARRGGGCGTRARRRAGSNAHGGRCACRGQRAWRYASPATAERFSSPSPPRRFWRCTPPPWCMQRHPRRAARGRRAAHRALRHHPPPLSAAQAQARRGGECGSRACRGAGSTANGRRRACKGQRAWRYASPATAERFSSPSPPRRLWRRTPPPWCMQRHPRRAARGRRAAHRALRNHPPPLSAAQAQARCGGGCGACARRGSDSAAHGRRRACKGQRAWRYASPATAERFSSPKPAAEVVATNAPAVVHAATPTEGGARTEGSAQGAAPSPAAAERCPSPSLPRRRMRRLRPPWCMQRHPRRAARERRAARRALRNRPPPMSAAQAQARRGGECGSRAPRGAGSNAHGGRRADGGQCTGRCAIARRR